MRALELLNEQSKPQNATMKEQIPHVSILQATSLFGHIYRQYKCSHLVFLHLLVQVQQNEALIWQTFISPLTTGQNPSRS